MPNASVSLVPPHLRACFATTEHTEMTRTWILILSACLLTSLAACGDSNSSSNPTPPSSNGGENTTNNSENNNNSESNNNDGENNNTEENPFEECNDAEPCANGICQANVCLNAPASTDGALHYEFEDAAYPVEGTPNISCYADPVPTGDDVEYVTSTGKVEKFGVGGSTIGLCITVYNYDRFLKEMETRCGGITDAEDLETCYQMDPCRCEKDNTGDQEAIDSCFADIGYCNGIADDAARSACQANYAYDGDNPSRNADTESTLIYGHTKSFQEGDNNDEGHYSVEGIPTNTNLVIKTSGSLNRWIDTYEYGAILTQNDGGESTWDTNAISVSSWNTIPSTALVPAGIKSGAGAIAGRLHDCGMEGRTLNIDGTEHDISDPLPIKHATVGLVRDAVRITYFNANPEDLLPEHNQTSTNDLAVYTAISVPMGFNRVTTASQIDGEATNVGYRDIFMTPRSVGIVTFEGAWIPAAW